MLVTVTNDTSRTINALDAVDNRVTSGPADLYATGGAKTDPLPYPFDQVGELTAGSSIQRAMHIGDFRRQHNMATALEPNDEWNQLINAGTISLVFTTAEDDRQDFEENFDLAIV